MEKKLIELSTNYELTSIHDRLLNLDKPLDLKIGFLGEFSSGKSTLINALLNQKVLPSMDKPTSKSVIEIVAKDNITDLEFYELYDNKKEPISAIEFSKIALEDGESKAMIYAPSNDFFQDGYMMIDTPGISSLDKSDIDITYGYLPFLDCAVICNHIQKGSLTQSIIDFLLKDEIRPIINNILFVITNSHSKSPVAQKKIKEEIINQLNTVNEKHTLGMENIDSKVILVSAFEAMEGKEGFSLDAIKNSFNENFMSKKILLQEERKSKELEKIAEQLLEALKFKKENGSLDMNSLKEKEEELNNTIITLEKEKSELIQSLQIIEAKIEKSIYTIFERYLPQLKRVKNQEQIKVLMNEIEEVLARSISEIISLYFEDILISNEHMIQFSEVEMTIQELLEQINMGKDIGMVILIEILTLGTAGLVGVFGFFLRSTSQMIMNQKGENNLKDTANFINQVNPLELIGDRIGSKLIEEQMVSKIELLSQKIAIDIKDELEVKIQKEIFKPLEDKLIQNKKLLNDLYREKSEKLEPSIEVNRRLDDDILELQLNLRD
ncbi:MAG: hypothetical protein DSZ07_07810 [Sulfurovum sp.]|nr:MAG: hypothetical protein DSZ07_07810 [Sulfurovum sp.]